MTGSLVNTVILMKEVTVPPVLVAFMTNMVRLSNCVGVPLITPVEVSNTRPSGRLGSIDQPMISPAPDTIGVNGKSALAVLLTRAKSSGE